MDVFQQKTNSVILKKAVRNQFSGGFGFQLHTLDVMALKNAKMLMFTPPCSAVPITPQEQDQLPLDMDTATSATCFTTLQAVKPQYSLNALCCSCCLV